MNDTMKGRFVGEGDDWSKSLGARGAVLLLVKATADQVVLLWAQHPWGVGT